MRQAPRRDSLSKVDNSPRRAVGAAMTSVVGILVWGLRSGCHHDSGSHQLFRTDGRRSFAIGVVAGNLQTPPSQNDSAYSSLGSSGMWSVSRLRG
jgi:hypothetical protein